MSAIARLRNVTISAQKVRLVADQIRGLAVADAINILRFSPKHAAREMKGVLESAIANAENNHGDDIDTLNVKRVFVDEGRTLKRLSARAKGRANRISKRSCHITIEVASNEE